MLSKGLLQRARDGADSYLQSKVRSIVQRLAELMPIQYFQRTLYRATFSCETPQCLRTHLRMTWILIEASVFFGLGESGISPWAIGTLLDRTGGALSPGFAAYFV